jgi:hypothetical protein
MFRAAFTHDTECRKRASLDVPVGLVQAAKSAISSAPEFRTENTLIFQCLVFGTKLLIYANGKTNALRF